MKGARGTAPACAVCKFQRRKCKPDCVLAPYFPANEPETFQNVHRLFGVSNVMKLLKSLESEEQREEAMKSIKYEADMRRRYPVYGCAGIIFQLQQHLNQNIEELRNVRDRAAAFREHININNVNINNNNNYVQITQLTDYEEGFMMKNQYYDEHDNYVMDIQPTDGVDGDGLMKSDGVDEDVRGKQVYYDDDDDDDDDGFADDDDKQSFIENKEACISSGMDSFLQAFKRSSLQ